MTPPWQKRPRTVRPPDRAALNDLMAVDRPGRDVTPDDAPDDRELAIDLAAAKRDLDGIEAAAGRVAYKLEAARHLLTDALAEHDELLQHIRAYRARLNRGGQQ